MKRLRMLAALLLLCAGVEAKAGVLTFNATGVAGISGFVQFDDSYFAFFLNFIPNTAIVGLSLNVFGEQFDLADVSTSSATLGGTQGGNALIINGFGLLADNGVRAIAFYPDGFDGTPVDGDASLSFQVSPSSFPAPTYPVRWVAATAVTEPASLALIALALVAFALTRRSAGATAIGPRDVEEGS
jgi:hypothetical protein